jgi:hypothetical protein
MFTSSLLLLGMVGLAVDTGYGYYLKQMMQATADSAALAGAKMAMDNGFVCGTNGVSCSSGNACPASPNNPPVTVIDEACLYGQKNGGSATIKISAGTGAPPSNSGVTPSYWVTATASQNFSLSFMQMLGFRTATVTASATSGVLSSGAAGGCIWILDSNGSGAFTAAGNSNLQSNCTIFVNSNATDAFTAKGGSVVHASQISVVGGTSIANNATISPSPQTGVSTAADPLAWLPDPVVPTGCDYTNLQIGGGVTNLLPGNYCGGIKASAQAQINFAAGHYYLIGGGMQVTSAQATLNGTGVFFYNTGNAAYPFGSVVIVSGATINLAASTDSTDTYKGILLFQDRRITSSATTAFGGGSNETYRGTIYLPTGYLQFVGGSNTQSLTMALIAKDLNVAGNAYITKDLSGNITGIAQNQASLIQ